MDTAAAAATIKTAGMDHPITQVAEILPAYRSGEWSPLERGVFNQLLANTIRRGGAATVTSEVLNIVQKDMLAVVRQYTTWQSREQ
jgi:hypothetical protein